MITGMNPISQYYPEILDDLYSCLFTLVNSTIDESKTQVEWAHTCRNSSSSTRLASVIRFLNFRQSQSKGSYFLNSLSTSMSLLFLSREIGQVRLFQLDSSQGERPKCCTKLGGPDPALNEGC